MKFIKVYSGSAITVLNAIKSSHGAAIGIDIPISVEIQPSKSLSFDISPKGIEPTLLISCIDIMEKKWNIDIDNIRITTKSPLLAARGLKTSSSISCALIQGLSKYYKRLIALKELISLGAKASITAGVSITGATDDAYASFCGGLAYTENKSRQLISLKNYDSKSEVILLIPSKTNEKMDIARKLEDIDYNLIKEALRNFQKGDIISAIKYNTLAYGPHLLHNFEVIKELEKLNPEVVGLNGAGPSLFVLCEQEYIDEFNIKIRNSFSDYIVINAPIKKIKKSVI